MDKLRAQLARLSVRHTQLSNLKPCILCDRNTCASDHGLCAGCFTYAASDAFRFERPAAKKIAECTICFHDITDDDPADVVFACPGCLTIFHHPCLQTWWRRIGVDRCPTCNVDTAHIDDYLDTILSESR